MPEQMRGLFNSPEFRELHDQNQNTYRTYPHHCAVSHFAPMSAHAQASPTIEETTEERILCPNLELQQCFFLESFIRFVNQRRLNQAFFTHFTGRVPARLFGAQCSF